MKDGGVWGVDFILLLITFWHSFKLSSFQYTGIVLLFDHWLNYSYLDLNPFHIRKYFWSTN